jgi:hypothetical protein
MRFQHHTASTSVAERREATARRRRRTARALCGLVAGLVLTAAVPAVAAAATLYVDKHNSRCVTSGTGAGSATTPYCTISASRLVISRRTAEHHVQHIYAKVGVSSRAALALFAHEHDLTSAAAYA